MTNFTKTNQQMWLVCYYHRHGSLYDYLQQNVLDHRHAIRLALTAANGLAHLHTAIFGVRVRCFIYFNYKIAFLYCLNAI